LVLVLGLLIFVSFYGENNWLCCFAASGHGDCGGIWYFWLGPKVKIPLQRPPNHARPIAIGGGVVFLGHADFAFDNHVFWVFWRATAAGLRAAQIEIIGAFSVSMFKKATCAIIGRRSAETFIIIASKSAIILNVSAFSNSGLASATKKNLKAFVILNIVLFIGSNICQPG
jgi:hypothetical protein